MTKKNRAAAFTLIELLIVITIIAVLASIALPAFTGVKERGDQTKDLSNAKQVALSLRQFAMDNNGAYPAKKPSGDYSTATALAAGDKSNDAFWWLFPTYLQSESIFAISGSAYTPGNPDNKLDPDTATFRTETLKKGENSFAYVSGLTDTSNPTFPLIADGFSDTVGTYSQSKAQAGGVWSGKKAVVVFCDASGQLMAVDRVTHKIKRPPGSSTPDYFTGNNNGDWIDATANPVLNPDKP